LHRHALRQLSNASSSASSFQESGADGSSSFEPSPNASGLHVDHPVLDDAPASETPPGGGAGTEPMFNFRSLAAVIGDEDKDSSGNLVTHVEDASHPTSAQVSPRSPTFPKSATGGGQGQSSSNRGSMNSSSGLRVSEAITPPERPLSTGERLFGVSGAFSPPASPTTAKHVDSGEQISKTPGQDDEVAEGGAVLTPQASNPYDAKHYGDISILDSGPFSTGQGLR